MLPPLNVLALALVRLIVPVPVTVSPVEIMLTTDAPDAAILQVPEPKAKVLVFAPEERTALDIPHEEVKLYVEASNVPAICEKPLFSASASNNVTAPPGVLTVIDCVNNAPALVIV